MVFSLRSLGGPVHNIVERPDEIRQVVQKNFLPRFRIKKAVGGSGSIPGQAFDIAFSVNRYGRFLLLTKSAALLDLRIDVQHSNRSPARSGLAGQIDSVPLEMVCPRLAPGMKQLSNLTGFGIYSG